MDFVVYHSAYELPTLFDVGGQVEGPYSDATSDVGVNRLIYSVLEAGVVQQRNVYAELGTTWFSLVRRPVEAAHVLGKLIKYLGEDNVIWARTASGTDRRSPLSMLSELSRSPTPCARSSDTCHSRLK